MMRTAKQSHLTLHAFPKDVLHMLGRGSTSSPLGWSALLNVMRASA